MEIIDLSTISGKAIFDIMEDFKLTKEKFETIANAKNKEQIKQPPIISRMPKSIIIFPHLDGKNRPRRMWENLEPILKHEEIFPVFNEMTKDYDVLGLGVDGYEHQLMDIHSMCQRHEFNVSFDFVAKSVNRIGKKNSYNPVIDYLELCHKHWDGQAGRIKDVFNTLKIREDFPKDLAFELFVKWLITTATLPYNDGTKNSEGVLVFQGPQGCGKTTFINIIIPSSFLKTGLELNPSDKDSVRQCVKYWVVELGELDSTLKAEQSKLKAFLTEKVDEFRIPYDRSPMRYPRMTSFFGTVNKEEFLKDETGDRRYWVIPVDNIDIDTLRNIDIPQFWGEIMDLKSTGTIPLQLTKEQLNSLNKSNSDFRTKGFMEIQVETGFNWNVDKKYWQLVSLSEIAKKLKLKSTGGLKELIIKYGGTYKRTNKVRGYIVPPFKDNDYTFSQISSSENPF